MSGSSWLRHLPSPGRIVVGAALLFLLGQLVLPIVVSFPLLGELRAARAELVALGPAPADLDAELRALENIQAAAAQLHEGQLGWLGVMLLGSTVQSARAARVEALGRDVVGPAHRDLAERMRRGGNWIEQRDRLAAYLMTAGRGPRDGRARELLGPLVVERLVARSKRPPRALREWIDELLDPNRDLLAGMPPLAVDEALVGRIRAELAATALTEKIEAATVGKVAAARYADGEPQYPPLTLERILGAEAAFAGVLRHRSATAVVVPGPLTGWGRAGVLAHMAELEKDLSANEWVVSSRPEERGEGLAKAVAKAIESFDAKQKDAWLAFLADIMVHAPASVSEAERVLLALAQREGPYVLLLHEIEAATSRLRWDPSVLGPGMRRGTPRAFPRVGGSGQSPHAAKIDSPIEREENGEAWWVALSGRETPPLADLLGGMVALGPRQQWPREETVLEHWARRIHSFRFALVRAAEADNHGEPTNGKEMLARARAEGRRDTESDLARLDEVTRRIWRPLLLAPFDMAPSVSR